MKSTSACDVKLPSDFWPEIGKGLLKKAEKLGCRCLAVSVGVTHSHVLIELPGQYEGAKRVSGQLKQAASHRVRDKLPGKLWAGGGKPIEVNDQAHQQRVYAYILRHHHEGDWTWSLLPHRDAVVWGLEWLEESV